MSVLFATGKRKCHSIKKIVMKKNNFAEASYHFADVNYHFAGKNWQKPIWCKQFLTGANYHFANANWEKPILQQHFIAKAKKSEIHGLFA